MKMILTIELDYPRNLTLPEYNKAEATLYRAAEHLAKTNRLVSKDMNASEVAWETNVKAEWSNGADVNRHELFKA